MLRLRITIALLFVPACFAEGNDDGGNDSEGTTGMDITATASAGTLPSTSSSATVTASGSGTSTSATATSDASTTTSPTTEGSSSDTTDTSGEAGSSSSGPGEDEIILDLALHACDGAEWSNDEGTIVACPTFPGDEAQMEGTVFRAEDMTIPVDPLGQNISMDAIAVHPRWAANGQIVGRYDPVAVESGDLFLAEVVCVQDVTCEAEAIVSIVSGAAGSMELDRVPLRFDDPAATAIEVEVPAGNEVQLILTVDSGDASASDGVVWIEPRLLRPAG